MARVIAFCYGLLAYATFLVAFLYAIAFVGDLRNFVPRTIDSGGPTADSLWRAFLIDALLLGAFAVQHSVMARPAFKRRWTQFVPAPVERSTYVLLSSLLLLVLYWQWRPLDGVVWDLTGHVTGTVLSGVFWTGWLTVLIATFLIDHFDLFGLRQVALFLRSRPYEPPAFTARLFYRWIRHPIMLGFILAFWASPRMTTGHLVFAIATTVYILLAIRLEERDLLALHGERYSTYREKTSMILPLPRRGG